MDKIYEIDKELEKISKELMNKHNMVEKIYKEEIQPLYFKLRELQDKKIKILNKESK